MEGEPRTHGVLLVDDYEGLRSLYRAGLEALGPFRVVGEAADGQEAVAAAVRLKPEVVLLDLSMPNADGLEALVALRRALPETHVVVLSGFLRERVEEAVLALGATAYLEKGLSLRELVESVEAAVREPPRAVGAPSEEALRRWRELI